MKYVYVIWQCLSLVWIVMVTTALIMTACEMMNKESHADQSRAALDNALRAAYMQSGMKSDVDNFGKCMEKRYVDKDMEQWWGSFLFIANSLSHNGVYIKWTF